MIDLLKIQDLGVIAHAELPLGPGFTAITGETGAGKTMVISALGLLMGERSDAGAVRSGAERARVSGFITTKNKIVIDAVEDAGGSLESDELSLVRTVSAEGRSRASIGGAGAPAGVLQRIAPHLFAVHGQSEQLRLKSATAQREALDRFGGPKLLDLLDEYGALYEQTAAANNELEELQTERLERIREAEQLRSELAEIDDVDPHPTEFDELSESVSRLANVEELRGASDAARVLLARSEDPAVPDAVDLIASAGRELERAAASDSKLLALHERLVSAQVQIDEIALELSTYSNSLDFDGPAELARATDRLEALTGLMRKFGSDTEQVLGYRESAAARLKMLDGDDVRIETLTKQVAELDDELQVKQKQITKLRQTAAQELSVRVSEELSSLALPDAKFYVEVSEATPNKTGADSAEMLLQPHPGATARPVAKGASGGELSRVMLALEVVLAGKDPVATFVFDEVDAGIGGTAAIEIGRRLARLAKTSQVIVVTHLAQVAAFADNHLLVQKDSEGGFTESSCTQLYSENRLAEIARLLSGMSDSESAIAHAGELLELARSKK